MDTYDLSEEEFQIFLAETDEQLQSLEEGLMRSELESADSELIQQLFRAAHTLKGSAGMLDFVQIVKLTHALETIFNEMRKGRLEVNTALVDICLEAVDTLRSLRHAIDGTAPIPVEVDPILERMAQWAAFPNEAPTILSPVTIQVDIAPGSAGSAARAFQVMLALQENGEILQMTPTREEIESARPVRQLSAEYQLGKPLGDLTIALQAISEIDRVKIGGELILPSPPREKKINAPQQPSNPETENASRRHDDQTVRTSVKRLDTLVNLVGELITDRNRLFLIQNQCRSGISGEEGASFLAETVNHIGRIVDQLQDEIMGIRMLPISNIFNKFPRLVRDLAHQEGKQVKLVIRGEETELDRSVLQQIGDPLIHLIRNAVDHGLESAEERLAAGKPEKGTIQLTANHLNGQIMIEVRDDGRGLDIEKIKTKALQKGLLREAEAASLSDNEAADLIFHPGLSTASEISDISGRGVGMDIVKTNIESLNGTIIMDSKPGEGTQFQLILPLTLAIVKTLLVQAGGGIFAVPLVSIQETLRFTAKKVQKVGGKPALLVRETVLPLIWMDQALESGHTLKRGDSNYVVAIHFGKTRLGLVVEKLIGEQEVIVKPLGVLSGKNPGLSGAAILGDGQIALVLDVKGIFQIALSRRANPAIRTVNHPSPTLEGNHA